VLDLTAEKTSGIVWLLSVIAFIGMIGALALNDEPKKLKIKKKQTKNFSRSPGPNNDLLEIHLISELDQLQLTAG
jgi:hypothetical protein